MFVQVKVYDFQLQIYDFQLELQFLMAWAHWSSEKLWCVQEAPIFPQVYSQAVLAQ